MTIDTRKRDFVSICQMSMFRCKPTLYVKSMLGTLCQYYLTQKLSFLLNLVNSSITHACCWEFQGIKHWSSSRGNHVPTKTEELCSLTCWQWQCAPGCILQVGWHHINCLRQYCALSLNHCISITGCPTPVIRSFSLAFANPRALTTPLNQVSSSLEIKWYCV